VVEVVSEHVNNLVDVVPLSISGLALDQLRRPCAIGRHGSMVHPSRGPDQGT
jgi:hypothetical protein